jgi:hypothetical protein
MYKRVFTVGKLHFYEGKFMEFSPEFSEMLSFRKKFTKFDEIIRNIFRGIFLRRKVSPGNFPEILEIKRLFTAGNLSCLKRRCCHKFIWAKWVV